MKQQLLQYRIGYFEIKIGLLAITTNNKEVTSINVMKVWETKHVLYFMIMLKRIGRNDDDDDDIDTNENSFITCIHRKKEDFLRSFLSWRKAQNRKKHVVFSCSLQRAGNRRNTLEYFTYVLRSTSTVNLTLLDENKTRLRTFTASSRCVHEKNKHRRSTSTYLYRSVR